MAHMTRPDSGGRYAIILTAEQRQALTLAAAHAGVTPPDFIRAVIDATTQPGVIDALSGTTARLPFYLLAAEMLAALVPDECEEHATRPAPPDVELR